MSGLRELANLAHDLGITMSCDEAGVDPDLMFPERDDLGAHEEAKRLCRSCDLRAECLEYAVDRRVEYGVWGGMSEREREAMRKRAYRGGSQPETLPLAV